MVWEGGRRKKVTFFFTRKLNEIESTFEKVAFERKQTKN